MWELSLPPMILKIYSPEFEVTTILEQVKQWAVMGHEVFSSILEKLCLLDTDNGTFFYKFHILSLFLFDLYSR